MRFLNQPCGHLRPLAAGGIFDRLRRSAAFVLFVAAVTFLQLIQIDHFFQPGRWVVRVRPSAELSRLISESKSAALGLLTAAPAMAAQIDGGVELSAVTDAPDPFSPNADGTKDTAQIRAEFAVDVAKLREFDTRTAQTNQYFLDWTCRILQISDSAAVRRLAGREPLAPADLTSAADTLAVEVPIVWEGASDSGGAASEGGYDYQVRGFLVSDIDTAPPVLTLTNLSAGRCITTPDLQITGLLNERGSIIINGTDTVPVTSATGFSFISPPVRLAEGVQTVTIEARDVFDNVTTHSVVVTVDFTPPAVRWVSPSPGAMLSGRTARLQAELTDNLCGVDSSSILILVNDDAAVAEHVAFGDSVLTAAVTLREGLLVGPNKIEVRALDLGGNASVAALDLTVEPPAPADAGGVVVGTVLDAVSGQPVAGASVTVDGEDGGVLSGADGSFRISVPGASSRTVRVEKYGMSRVRFPARVEPGHFLRLDPAYLIALEPVADTVIGASGGTFQIPGSGSTLRFPPNAFAGHVPLRAAVYPDPSRGPVPSPQSAATIFAVELRPSGLSFDSAPTLSTPNTLGAPAGTALPAAVWDDRLNLWVEQPPAALNADFSMFQIAVHRFSTVRVLSLAPPAPVTGSIQIASGLGGGGGGEGAGGISLNEGYMEQHVTIPWTRILGQDRSLDLVYLSNTADPSQTQRVELSVSAANKPSEFVEFGLSIEDRFVQPRFFGRGGVTSYTHFWNGRTADGQSMPSGLYPFEVRFDEVVRNSQLFSSVGLDPAGRRELASIKSAGETAYRRELNSSFILNNRTASPFGAGWWLNGLEKLNRAADGRVFILNGQGTARIFSETADTAFTEFQVPGAGVVAMAIDPAGRFYFLDQSGGRVLRSAGESSAPEPILTGISSPVDLVVAGRGRNLLVIAEHGTSSLIVSDTEGRILHRIASVVSDGRAITLRFPGQMGVDSKGFVYFADQSRRVYLLDPDDGLLVEFSADKIPGNTVGGLAVDPQDRVYVSSDNSIVYRIDRYQNVRPFSTAAPLNVNRLAVDSAGRLCAYASAHPFAAVSRITSYDNDGKAISYFEPGQELQPSNGFFVSAEKVYLINGSTIRAFPRGRRFIESDPRRERFAKLQKQDDGGYRLVEKDLTQKLFDSFGNHAATIDPNGNRTSFGYIDPAAPDPLLTSITDAAGQTVTFAYSGGRLASITDNSGRTTAVRTDAAGDLVGVTLPDGSTQSFTYNDRHLLTARTDAKNAVTRYTLDPRGRVSSMTDPGGEVGTLIAQDVQGLVNDLPPGIGTRVSPAEPVGPQRSVFTDGGGRTRAVRHDRFGQPLESVDDAGLKTTVVRNAAGRPFVIDRPDDDDRRFFYTVAEGCGCGDVSRIEEGRAAPGPDGIPNLVDLKAFQTFEYDPRYHKVTRSVDKLGRATQTVYDDRANPVRIIDPDGEITELEYESRGLVTLIRDPTGKETRFTYNTQGNVSSTVDPLGGSTSLGYDGAGNVNAVTDAQNRTTGFTYNSRARLTAVTDPNGKKTSYDYDLNGNLTKITDARGNVTQFFYNAQNQLIRRVNALGQQESFTFDGSGNLIEKTKADGTRITFLYDGSNRLLEKIMPDDRVVFQYDPTGRLVGVRDNDSRLKMEYDFASRLVRQTQAGFTAYEFTIEYAFDIAGNRTLMRHSEMPPGTAVHYEFDTQNRVTKISDQYGEGIEFGYNASGNRTRMNRNGGRLVSTWDYDEKNRVTDITHANNGAPVSFFKYTYNASDNRTSMTDRYGVHNYVYDSLDRLTHATHPQTFNPTENFTFDAVGNRLSDERTSAYGYDQANRLQTDGIYSYTFDVNGNMTEKRLIDMAQASFDTPGRTSYVFDAEDRLVRVEIFNDGLGPVADKTVKFRYDGLGRRIEKKVFNGTSLGDIFNYFYDEEDIVARRVVPGSPLVRLDKLSVGEIRASVLDGKPGNHTNRVFLGTDRGVIVMNTLTGEQTGWTTSSGHLLSDGVRDLFYYDATPDSVHFDRSGVGKSWSGLGEFPVKSLIVTTEKEVAIIDARSDRLWHRFVLGDTNGLRAIVAPEMFGFYKERIRQFLQGFGHEAIPMPTNLEEDRLRPEHVIMLNGQLLIEMNVAVDRSKMLTDPHVRARIHAGEHMVVFDFKKDEIRRQHSFFNFFPAPNHERYLGKIADANAGKEWVFVQNNIAMSHLTGFQGTTASMDVVRIDGTKPSVFKVQQGLPATRQVPWKNSAWLAIDPPVGGDIWPQLVNGGFEHIGVKGLFVKDVKMMENGDMYYLVTNTEESLEGVHTHSPDVPFQGEPLRTGYVLLSSVVNGNSLAHAFRQSILNPTLSAGGGFGGVFGDNYYRSPLASSLDGRVEPLSLEAVEGGSLLDTSARRLFVGLRDGISVVDEDIGDTVLPFSNGITIPFGRINNAKIRNFYPRSISNGELMSDEINQVIPLDKNRALAIQKSGSLLLLDFSSVSQEQFQAFTHGKGITDKQLDEPLIVHTENPTTKEITTDYYLSDALGSITELVGKDGTITAEFVFNSYGKIVHSSGNALDQPYAFTGREWDREAGLLFLRSRYMDPWTGRFLQADPLSAAALILLIQQTRSTAANSFAVEEFGKRRLNPQFLHEYVYGGNNSILLIDPTGAFLSFGEIVVASIAVGAAFATITAACLVIKGASQSEITTKSMNVAVLATAGTALMLGSLEVIDLAAALPGGMGGGYVAFGLGVLSAGLFSFVEAADLAYEACFD